MTWIAFTWVVAIASATTWVGLSALLAFSLGRTIHLRDSEAPTTFNSTTESKDHDENG